MISYLEVESESECICDVTNNQLQRKLCAHNCSKYCRAKMKLEVVL